jgi:hypothetical protein
VCVFINDIPLAGARLQILRIVSQRTAGPVDSEAEYVLESRVATIAPRTGLSLAVQAHSIRVMQDGVEIAEITQDHEGNQLNLIGFRVEIRGRSHLETSKNLGFKNTDTYKSMKL